MVRFFTEFVRSPRAIGSLIPSSAGLARAIADALEGESTDVIVELGAGTGPITKHLLQRFPAAHLIAVEPNHPLADTLDATCPGADRVRAMASDLPQILAERGIEKADVIISGLPLAVWSPEQQEATLDLMVAHLADHGVHLQFSYFQSQLLPSTARYRRALRARFAEIGIGGWTLQNLPPALVWKARGPRSDLGGG